MREGGGIAATTLTPVLDEERSIRAAVAGLQKQDLPGELEFVFVDGRSSDGTRAILEELAREDPRIRVLDNPRRQTASALNIGLVAARGEYVARIDAHARYPPDYLSRAVERLCSGDVDWVAGPQVPAGRRGWSRAVALALCTPLATGGSGRWERDTRARGGAEVTLRTGVFCGVWRRATLLADGGWDEGWPVNQDAELAARVLARGGRIVSLPELAAEYVPRSSPRALARQYGRYGIYRAKTALRHPSTVRPAHLGPPVVVLAAVAGVAAPRSLRRAARGALGLYGAAIASAAARLVPDAGADAVAVPAVLVIMHGAWGAGWLVGLVRFAAPSRRRPALASERRRDADADADAEGEREHAATGGRVASPGSPPPAAC